MAKRAFNLRDKTQKVPTAMAGLALAIASLGWCFENVLTGLPLIKSLSALIAFILILLITAKFIVHPNIIKHEIAHPVVGSVMPTYAMALMVISHSIFTLNTHLAEAIWLVAIIIHCLFLVSFIYHRVQNFKLSHMLPSWFIPPIGLVVANVTYTGNIDYYPLANAILYFGLICYAVMLPMMIYRLIFEQNIPCENKPTIAVLAAPASLSLVGYLSMSTDPSPVVIAVLLGVALVMTFSIYVAFLHLLKLPFSPAFAAFTFPTVISSTALFKVSQWMESQQIAAEYTSQINFLAHLELTIAVIIVSFVSVKYISHLTGITKTEQATS